MAGSIIQEAQNSSSSVLASIAIALPSAVTQGSTIHVFCHNLSSTTKANGLSVTDSQSNPYTVLGGQNTADQGSTSSWIHAYSANVKGGATTVTMHTLSGQFVSVWAKEIGGVTAAPLVGHNIIVSKTTAAVCANVPNNAPAFMSALGSGDVNMVFNSGATTIANVSPLIGDHVGWGYSGSIASSANSGHKEVATAANTSANYSFTADGTSNVCVAMAIFLEKSTTLPIRFFANGQVQANNIISSASPFAARLYMGNNDIQVSSVVTGDTRIRLLANGQLICATTHHN